MIFDNVELLLHIRIEVDGIEADDYEQAQRLARQKFIETCEEKPETLNKMMTKILRRQLGQDETHSCRNFRQ